MGAPKTIEKGQDLEPKKANRLPKGRKDKPFMRAANKAKVSRSGGKMHGAWVSFQIYMRYIHVMLET
jgi:nicotinate-nucleotide pyrophosphorylase